MSEPFSVRAFSMKHGNIEVTWEELSDEVRTLLLFLPHDGSEVQFRDGEEPKEVLLPIPKGSDARGLARVQIYYTKEVGKWWFHWLTDSGVELVAAQRKATSPTQEEEGAQS